MTKRLSILTSSHAPIRPFFRGKKARVNTTRNIRISALPQPVPRLSQTPFPKGPSAASSLLFWVVFMGRFVLYTALASFGVGMVLTISYFSGWMSSLETGFVLFVGLTASLALGLSVLAMHQTLRSSLKTQKSSHFQEEFWD